MCSGCSKLLSQNALVVRGTPDQIALAEKLVEDLDKARPEVIVDIAVLQVSKDKSRTLGLSPPTSATVTLQSNINTTTPTTSTGSTTTTSTSSGTGWSEHPGDLNATDFQVTIPSANLSAVMGDTDTKMLQNPQVRALDNQKATLRSANACRWRRDRSSRESARGHQPAGEHAVSIPGCRRKYRRNPARTR